MGDRAGSGTRWVAVLLWLVLAQPAVAALSSIPDSETWTADGSVDAIARHGGDTYVGGNFRFWGPRTGSFVGLSGTGATLPPFPEVAGGIVDTAVSDGQGGAFIGGTFLVVGGESHARIAHITAAGAVDHAFATSVSSQVEALALSADGQTLYVGGFFRGSQSFGGQTRQELGALDAHTGLVLPWGPNVSGSISDPTFGTPNVTALAIAGGSVFVGGDFGKIDGVARAGLAKIDPSTGVLDSSWNPGAKSSVLALLPQGSNLVVGGFFSGTNAIGGATRNRIARVSQAGTGTVDSFDPSANAGVRALALSGDGTRIFLGGDFTQLGGQPHSHVAAVSTAGTIDAGFSPSLTASAYSLLSARVYSLMVSGTTLYLGGTFASINGQTRNNAGAVDASSGSTLPFDPSAGGIVEALVPRPTGVWAGGTFASVGAVERFGLARLDSRGRLVTGWSTSMTSTFQPPVSGLAVSPDGSTLYVGGGFSAIGGQTVNSLAALHTSDGSATGFDAKLSGSSFISHLALSPDGGTLYVMGSFAAVGSQSVQPARAGLAAVQTSDGSATAWNPNVDGGFPGDFELAPDGATMYVVGTFSQIGADHAARTQAAGISTTGPGNATAFAPQPDNAVYGVAVSPDSSQVALAGYFTHAGAQAPQPARQFVGIFSAGSGNATAFNAAASAQVNDVSWAPDGATIALNGSFDTVNGDARARLALVDAATGATEPWNPGTTSTFPAELDMLGPSLAITGSLPEVGGLATQGLTMFTEPPVSQQAPAITGTAAVGSVLTCSDGSWRYAPDALTRRWLRGGSAIAGETATTHTVTADDQGTDLTCSVTAANAGGSASATSAAVHVPAALAVTIPAPLLTGLRMSHRTFVVTAASTPLKGRAILAAKRHPRGTAFLYTLSAAASVRIAISKPAGGLRLKKRCLEATASVHRRVLRSLAPQLRGLHGAKRHARQTALLRKRVCTPTLGALVRAQAAGAQRVAFSGRLGRVALRPGAYRATAKATGAGGVSKPARVSFRVVRR